MDLSAGMITAAGKKARQQNIFNAAFFQADVAAMPHHFTERFDATFCFGAFHHYPDPLGAVREMRRVLNKRGRAFVVDPGPWWFKLIGSPLAKWGDPGWVNFYTGEELRDFFFSAGFADFYWSEILPGFGMCIAGK
jgi:ubiquinone/menaquinone biosynthesis C-methylase UbiE